MPRDYRYSDDYRPGPRPLPLWLWVFSLASIGSFAGLIYYLDHYERTKDVEVLAHRSTPKQQSPAGAQTPQDKAGEAQQGKSKFDFYKLLPRMQVEVPDASVSQPPRDSATQKDAAESVTTAQRTPAAIGAPAKQTGEKAHAPTPQSPPVMNTNRPAMDFILQAGSFRDYREADRMRAGLALLGIESSVKRVVLNGTDVWHRVHIGPLHSEREVEKVRSQLRANNIDSMLIRSQ